MKNCPYCGEAISDAAKKCKHCKSWIVEKEPVKTYKYCPFCHNPVPEYAEKCVNCGEWLVDENIELTCGYGLGNPVVKFLLILTVIVLIVGIIGIDMSGNDSAAGGLMFVSLSIIIGGYLYLLPAIVAASKKHPQFVPILLVNFFFGATVIGWVGSMIWAATHRIGRHTHW